jgi:hypothetical protein
MTSCPFRVTLGLLRATLASRSKTLGLLGPLDPATHVPLGTQLPPKCPKRWVTSWVTWVTSWAFQGLHHGEKGKTPLGPGLPGCPWWNVLLSLQCKPLIYLCPWLGSQHPSGGILALWRSELIISPCVPVHWVWPCNINKYTLHGLTSHRDHSNVNHI